MTAVIERPLHDVTTNSICEKYGEFARNWPLTIRVVFETLRYPPVMHLDQWKWLLRL